MKEEIANDDGVIVIRNLVKKFGSKVVLDGVSLEAAEGKTTVVIGPSGCGKTVLMKHMIVLERPNAGEVYFHGRRIDEFSEHELVKLRMPASRSARSPAEAPRSRSAIRLSGSNVETTGMPRLQASRNVLGKPS